MIAKLILRGLVCGIIAGLLAFGFARTLGEPAINVAIHLEETHAEQDRAAGVAAGKTPAPEEPEMFSRAIQSGPGLMTGIVGLGAGIGVIFPILFAFAYGRLGSLSAPATSAVLGLMGLVTVYVVPALKYPAAPPTVGHEETIKLRTGLYFLIIAISVLTTLAALAVRKGLIPRLGAWSASVVAALAYLAILTVVFLALPTINEVPADFPATTMWDFRIASLGIQTVLWISVSILFGYFNGLEKKA